MTIYLVGIEHNNRIHDYVIYRCIREAAKDNLVVFLEGFSVNPAEARRLCEQAFGIRSELVFGCETSIVDAICGVLLRLAQCRERYGSSLEKEVTIGKLQTIYDIGTIDEVRLAWEEIQDKLSPSAQELAGLINDLLWRFPSTRDLVGALNDFLQRCFTNEIDTILDKILNNPSWIEIYQKLYPHLIEKVPEEFQDVLRDERVNTFLNSDNNDNQDYVVNEINGRWREKFIAKNISDAIQNSAFAQREVCIFIGKQHLENLKVLLQQSLKGVEIRIVEDAEMLIRIDLR